MKTLSPKRQQIYDYIVSFSGLYGYLLSVRETGGYIGFKSPSTVHFRLKGLEAAGLIVKVERKTRTTTTSDPHPGAPEPAGGEPDQVPVVGSVAAGTPIPAQKCTEGYLIFDTGGLTGEHSALRIRGEFMRYAGILPGDLVVVHRQRDARSREIVVTLFEDEVMVEILCRGDGHIWLIPESPGYEPIDGDGCTILGKVMAVVQRC